jgi:hypothetical protein
MIYADTTDAAVNFAKVNRMNNHEWRGKSQ